MRSSISRVNQEGTPSDHLLFHLPEMSREQKKKTFASLSTVDIFQPHLPEKPMNRMIAIIKNREGFRQRVKEGKIIIKGEISDFDSTSVTFEDGTSYEIDTVIYCTGYKERHFPFLKKEYVPQIEGVDTLALYKHIVHPKYPSLFYIHMIAIAVAEMQTRYVANLLEGNFSLPSQDVMEGEVREHIERVRKSDQAHALISHTTYVEELMEDILDDVNYFPSFLPKPKL